MPRPLSRPLHSHLHKLHGFRLKLNRAQEHAQALDRDISAWFASHPYGVFGEYEPGPPERYVFRVRFLEPVPPTWAITLGDFAHNARSALDHLAYVVVLANNGGRDERTQFPIVVSPWAWRDQATKGIGNASERHLRIIESFQPYHRRDLSGWHTGRAAIEDPLAVLNRLSNIDKHRVLHATPAAIRSIGYDVHRVSDVQSIGSTEVPFDFLLDGEDMLRVSIVSDGPNPELRLVREETVEIRVQLRVDLTPDTYTLLNVPLKESADAILVRLREIFEVFVGEFR